MYIVLFIYKKYVIARYNFTFKKLKKNLALAYNHSS